MTDDELAAIKHRARITYFRQDHPEDDVLALVAEVKGLRAALLGQWEVNHGEQCSNEWPHAEGKRCCWEYPEELGEPAAGYRPYG